MKETYDSIVYGLPTIQCSYTDSKGFHYYDMDCIVGYEETDNEIKIASPKVFPVGMVNFITIGVSAYKDFGNPENPNLEALNSKTVYRSYDVELIDIQYRYNDETIVQFKDYEYIFEYIFTKKGNMKKYTITWP